MTGASCLGTLKKTIISFCCNGKDRSLMGIDLKVMASYFREHRGEMLPTATLRFDRDSGLFSKLSLQSVPCLVRPLPPDLKVGCYEDEGLVFRREDSRDAPLTWTTPATLAAMELPAELSPWNNAVLAFLLALPAETRIVFYWC
jgi:hypothetical protein